jgi:tetratricopeptide (TPR) repeat protein
MHHHSAFTLSLFFLCFLASPVAAVAQETLPALVKRIQPAIVTVVAYDVQGQAVRQGSGFFLTKAGHLLASRRVLYGTSRAEVKTQGGESYAVTQVVAEDREGDLLRVVVTIPETAVQPLDITKTEPETGDQIAVVGSPLRLEQTVSDGNVSWFNTDIPGFGKNLTIITLKSHGVSGNLAGNLRPVVNLGGEVIGVATLQDQERIFVIPGARVLALKLREGRTLTEWAEEAAKEWGANVEELYRKGLDIVMLVGGMGLGKASSERALPYFEQVVEQAPRNAKAWFYVCVCNAQLRRNQAIEGCKQAVRLDPDNAEAHVWLGDSYRVLGRDQEAVEAYKQVIRLDPDHKFAHLALGWSYQALGRHDEAIAAFKQVIRLDPDHNSALGGLRWSYRALGRHDEADGVHKQLEQRSERFEQSAAEMFKEGIRREPDNAGWHLGLGRTYQARGRYQEAVEAYKQAVRLDPNHVGAHFWLGRTYLLLDDKSSALEEYKILKTLDQELANLLFKGIYK